MEQIIENERLSQQTSIQEDVVRTEEEEEKAVMLSLNLPYAGDQGEKLVSKLRKYVTKVVNKNKEKVKINPVYKARKLGSSFNIKDKIKFEHQHNVVYHAKCPNKKCKSQYTGETRCRISKRTGQHSGKDKKSHLFRHSQRTKHKKVNFDAVKIIGQG